MFFFLFSSGAVLQQTFVVEYVVQGQMCDECHRVEAKDTWNASVSKIWKPNTPGIFKNRL